MPSCLHVAATSVLLLLNLELVAVDDFEVFFSYIIIVGLRSKLLFTSLDMNHFAIPK
jgi:hypothetical protein